MTKSLILLPRGCEAPAELLEGLRRRQVSVREVHDAPAAMTALARGRYLALVIVDPAAMSESENLARTVKSYHPELVVWQYRFDAQPALSHYGKTNGASHGSGKPMPKSPTPPAAFKPAAAAPRMDRQESEHETPPRPPVQSLEPVTLSDEELAMLLADDEPSGSDEG